jgi:two-component system chemotaxis response regulator CheB
MNHDIFVIGASAGSIGPLKQIADALPQSLRATLFAVVHVSRDSPGYLADYLRGAQGISAVFPQDGQPFERGKLYLAPPDHHLLIDRQLIRVVRGPRENGFRPAIDPLFRSAALHYGTRTVGIVLSGMLDDGIAGLAAIKQCGGVAVVQKPSDALYPSMPESALRVVNVDHQLAAENIPGLIQQLADTPVKIARISVARKKNLEVETQIAAAEIFGEGINDRLGKRSTFTCPECHGTLWEMSDDKVLRFRCHIGHGYSANALLLEEASTVENALSVALRTLEDSACLATQLARQAKEAGDSFEQSIFESRQKQATKEAAMIRELIMKGVSKPPPKAKARKRRTQRARRKTG